MTAGEMGAPDLASLQRRVRDLARPRLAGTDAADDTARRVRDRLEELGFQVRALPFEYSAWPGIHGLPVLGIAVVVTAAAAFLSLSAGRPGTAVVVLLALALAVTWALARLPAAIRRFPLARRTGANLLATRTEDDRPPVLLVAHLDSKSQGLPTLVRTLAGSAAALGWLGLTAGSAFAWLAAVPAPGAGVGAGLAIVGGLALAVARTGNRSPGALDNATGLVALLTLAGMLRDVPVAALVTDAEELGLVGARAAVGRVGNVVGVVNLDGLDDRGRLRVVYGRGLAGGRRPDSLLTALYRAAEQESVDVSIGRLPLGLLTDHMPFARAGVPAVTVLRGSLRSLARVHTPGDRADRLDGTGLAEAIRVVRRAAADPRLAGPV